MMEELLINFHFLRPWLLLLLLVPIFFYRRYFHGLNNQSSWEKVCDKKLLDFLLIKGSSKQRKIIAALAMLGFLSAVIAAAGPSWKKIEIPSLTEENPLMILLNMSSDMRENDVTPSRLERAKYKIKDLLPMVQGAQIGLEVYSNEPFLISPLTDDGQILSNLLPAIGFDIMPNNGDRLDRAIALAAEKLKNGGYSKGNILIFTPDVGQRFDLAIEQAKKATAEGFRINIINVSAKNNDKLQLIAQDSGGTYEKMQSSEADIKKIAKEIMQSVGDLKTSQNMQSIWLDYGYYLTILPLLCCLYFFRKGISVVILILGLSSNVQASFFGNANQDGLQYFQAEDYQRAAENFKDPNWQAATQYRMEDYAKALQYYSQKNDVTAMYNQGNALAKGGKIPEAIKKYEELLEIAPNHEDAKFNLEYLKKQQENQQNQQQQNQDQQQNEDNNQEQNQEQQNPQDNQGQDSPKENEQSSQTEQPTDGQQPQNGDERKNEGEQEQMNAEQQPTEAEAKEQKDEKSGANVQESSEENEEYDEEVQARAQQYREIPEDAGGLLKAFIRKEYNRNRYNEK